MKKNYKSLTFIVSAVFLASIIAVGVSAFTGGGDGSSGNPYQITSCVELQEMNNNLNAYYVLMNDIDCSDTVTWNSGAGFVPIGTFSSPFTGTFDGQNHKITGLFINRPSAYYVGLFGTSSNTIKNVGLVDVKITGSYYAGGLVGWNYYGTITNSYSTGSISGSDYVGGLVGQNFQGTITNSYATGNVNGYNNVGGLVGANYYGTITNSYATGNVSGTNEVGGLVGSNHYGGAITNSYATGSISGIWYVGGLVGLNYQGTITSSYWDTVTSGQSASAGGTGKTTAEMKQQFTFVDWDFTTIWAIKEGVSYPYFLWQIPPVLTCPSGMVSYWKFDEGSGTIASDSVGAHSGTIMGPTWTTGQVGNALQFDGVNDHVINLGTWFDYQTFTIALWVNPGASQATYADIIDTHHDGYYNWVIQQYMNNVNSYGFRNEQSFSLTANVWQHLAITKSGTTCNFYLNGNLVNSQYCEIHYTGDQYLTFGSHYEIPGRYWNGAMDEVAIYNRSLSAEEIQQHYQAGLQGEGYCDNIPPVIAAHDDVFAEATSSAGAVVNYVLPTATDNYDASVTVNCAPASGTTFAMGDTTVTCTATDAHGNAATPTTFKVTVKDATPPVVTVPADITQEATGPSGAVVTFSASATDIVDGTITPTCTPDSGSTFALGTTKVICTATDAAHNTGSASFNIKVQDTTPPVIAAHGDATAEATSALGAIVTYTSPATSDAVDGPGTAICSPASGTTFAMGDTTVTCTATDKAGNTRTASFKVTVNYKWSGFFQPVDNLPILDQVKAGSAIPVKFSLNGNMGLNIFETNYPASKAIVCDSTASVDAIEATVTAGGSSLTYDSIANQYIYVWKTDKLWSNSCRQLVVKLIDGTTHYANFKFTK